MVVDGSNSVFHRYAVTCCMLHRLAVMYEGNDEQFVLAETVMITLLTHRVETVGASSASKVNHRSPHVHCVE
jgi:hypothetical protein